MTAPIYFNHIPKTAGTSLRHSLSRLFAPEKCRPEWFLEDYLKVPAAQLEAVGFLAGHFGAYPLTLHPRKLKTLTFLREPISRAYSHFLHIQNDESHPSNQAVADMSFCDFIHSDLSEFELLNYQARFIGFSDIGDHFAALSRRGDRASLTSLLNSRRLLEQAKENLSRCFFVGLTESYASSLDMLSRHMGVPVENDARFNVAKTDVPMPTLSQADKSRLDWLTRFDTDLYELAKLIAAQQAAACQTMSLGEMPLSAQYFNDHVDLVSGWVGGGWGPVECYAGSQYVWSSTIQPWIGFLLQRPVKHRFFSRVATYDAQDVDDMAVTLNGVPVATSTHPCPGAEGGSFSYLWFDIPYELVHPNGLMEVRFHIKRTVNPKRDHGLEDDRDLGLYLNWARVQACV